VISPSHAVHLTLTAAVLGLIAAPPVLSAPQEAPAQSAASMKTYTETIPGTDIKFEMVPIPAGNFQMGAPAGEAKHGKDEEPQHIVRLRPQEEDTRPR
jgi:formylglycine-generating enzyme required for sulfatase activity